MAGIFQRAKQVIFGGQPKVRRAFAVQRVEARYDVAQTGPDNRNHWLMADALNADLAAAPGVRRILRQRARYEVENNSYAKGMIRTKANDTIGTGPRLQLQLDNSADATQIEADFASWARAIGLPQKLRILRMARMQDGEAFAALINNPRLYPIKLDLQLIECDRVQGEVLAAATPTDVDGIRFDQWGNPVSYRVLREHPGGGFFPGAATGEADEVPASLMIHYFNPERPEQHRGIPEITPGLPLLAQLRRYTLAVIAAAEAAADFAAVIYSDLPATEAANVDPLDEIELKRNMAITLPEGWKLGQMDPKQPAATYAEFKKEILNEYARCCLMPYNIAAGNSSGYNYSSGQLDHKGYFRAISIDQDILNAVVLDRILAAWMREYTLLRPQYVYAINAPHAWMWDGLEHADPSKEANAQKTRLESMTTSLSREYAKKGLDWEPEIRQIAREKGLLKDLGLTAAEAAPTAQKGQSA